MCVVCIKVVIGGWGEEDTPMSTAKYKGQEQIKESPG